MSPASLAIGVDAGGARGYSGAWRGMNRPDRCPGCCPSRPRRWAENYGRDGGSDCYRGRWLMRRPSLRPRRPKRCKFADGLASTGRGGEAPIELVARADRRLADEGDPDDESYRVSHETIYRSLFVQARGVLKKELLGHLRSRRTIRRSKRAGLNGDRRGQIKDLVSIRQRPAAVEDRAVPGDWEGDLLSGSKNSYIATLVERHTRYVMLAKVANKDTQTVIAG